MLLHCNGVLSEMREVAEAAGELKGKAMRRAKMALKSARKAQPFDRKAALADLDLAVSA
jgi:beta-N-acetylhexosaminidase